MTVGTHHDCEENEIVKWFPLYEGDAMFPAKKNVMFQAKTIVFKKYSAEEKIYLNGFLRLRHPIAFWARSGGGFAPTRRTGFFGSICNKKNFYGQ